MGSRLGDPDDPLLVSVRSGAKFSMPGMMDTVLNLGLNDQSVEGLAKQTGDERFAFDSYRRFVPMYGRIVLGVPGEEFDSPFEAQGAHGRLGRRVARGGPAGASSRSRRSSWSANRPAPSPRSRSTSCAAPSRPCSPPGTGRGPSPTDCGSTSRTTSARRSTCRPWSSATATTTRAPASASPVTRPPGPKGAYGDFLVNAQGEDVVAGIRNTEPLSALGAGSPRSTRSCWRSSPGSRRTTGTCATPSSPSSRASSGCCRPGWASAPAGPPCAWRSTWSTIRPSALTHAEAVPRITADHLDAVLHPQFADTASPVLAKGLGASPGAAVGPCASPPTTPQAAANGRATSSWCATRPPPRTCTACWPPRAS